MSEIFLQVNNDLTIQKVKVHWNSSNITNSIRSDCFDSEKEWYVDVVGQIADPESALAR